MFGVIIAGGTGVVKKNSLLALHAQDMGLGASTKQDKGKQTSTSMVEGDVLVGKMFTQDPPSSGCGRTNGQFFEEKCRKFQTLSIYCNCNVNRSFAISAILFRREIPTIMIYGFSFHNLKCLLISAE